MKISIIIPVYNSEKYIGKCLDSILNQTYKNIELICINDGSKDNSLSILREYEKKDDRIIVFDQKNKGIAETRNRGIDYSSGDYLMFVDNDDYVDNYYIENYVKNLGNNDIVIGGYKRIDHNGKILIRQGLDPKSDWSKFVVTAPWAKIYKKSFIIDNNIRFLNYIGEDIYFNLKCYSLKPKIKVIKNDDYVWFYNNESFSNSNKSKGTKSNIDVIKLLNYFKDITDLNDEYVKYFLKRYVVWYLIFMGTSSDYKEIKSLYCSLSNWLLENNIKKVINPFSRKLNGEIFKNRVAVFVFILFEKIHIQNLFIKLISRG